MFLQLDQLEAAANERSSSRWMAVERRARLVKKPSENPQCPADAKILADGLHDSHRLCDGNGSLWPRLARRATRRSLLQKRFKNVGAHTDVGFFWED